MQIVAPAGSISGLRAALYAGADAVYLGMSDFGARAKAANFGDEDLPSAINLAHLYGCKVFVTLNTVIKDGEMSRALKAAEWACACGADAAIVQDLRFIKLLKQNLPELTLYASTQLGVHNALGAKCLVDMGIKRAVLSRETLPEDIAKIKDTGIEIEFFVQGALCVCFSGNCYFSSLASSYSGNRGKCMQLCRKMYDFNGKRGYFLSAKDLCLYDELHTLEDLGVDAVKIEGRMRSDEYVYNAVKVYKSGLPSDVAKNILKEVFNRGDYCTAYLKPDAPFRIIYPYVQGNIGSPIGKIKSVKGNNIFVNGFVPERGDGFKVLRGKSEVCGAAERNGVVVADGACAPGDELRRTSSGELARAVRHIERKLDVSVTVDVAQNTPVTIKMSRGATELTVIGKNSVEPARSQKLSAYDVKRAFDKVADYPFSPKVSVNITGDCFIPVSELNELRRECYARFERKLLDDYSLKRTVGAPFGLKFNVFEGRGKILAVENCDVLDREIINSVDYIALKPRDYSHFDIPDIDKPILLDLPVAMRCGDEDILKRAASRDGIFGVISNNLYGLKLTDKPVLLGTGHNIVGNIDLPHIRSFEADRIASENSFAYVFGRAPVMTLCHCPYGKCIKCSGDDSLTDERGRKFALRRYKLAHCYWQLLNCVPHYLSDRDTAGARGLFYDCVTIDNKGIHDVLSGRYGGEYTRGNINKGLK